MRHQYILYSKMTYETAVVAVGVFPCAICLYSITLIMYNDSRYADHFSMTIGAL